MNLNINCVSVDITVSSLDHAYSSQSALFFFSLNNFETFDECNSLIIAVLETCNVINKAIHVEIKITITDCLFMCSEPFCFLYGVFYTNCHKLRRIERGKLSSSGARLTKFSLQI